jgi:hypothetical protein
MKKEVQAIIEYINTSVEVLMSLKLESMNEQPSNFGNGHRRKSRIDSLDNSP